MNMIHAMRYHWWRVLSVCVSKGEVKLSRFGVVVVVVGVVVDVGMLFSACEGCLFSVSVVVVVVVTPSVSVVVPVS